MIKSKVEALAEKCPLQPVLLRPRGEQQTAAVASACAEVRVRAQLTPNSGNVARVCVRAISIKQV